MHCNGNSRGVILLADGDRRTAPVMDLAIHHLELPLRLVGLPNGQEVIRYLQREGRYADEDAFPLPKLLLLDLSIKRVKAFDVLRWVRRNSAVRHSTVLVLARSVFDPDIARAYAVGANSFLVKAQDYGSILQQFRGIDEEWLRKRGQGRAPAAQRPSRSLAGAIPVSLRAELDSSSQQVKAFGGSTEGGADAM